MNATFPASQEGNRASLAHTVVYPMLRCPLLVSLVHLPFPAQEAPAPQVPDLKISFSEDLTWKNHIANADMPTAFVWAPTLQFLLLVTLQALTLLISLSVPLWVHSLPRRKNKTRKAHIDQSIWLQLLEMVIVISGESVETDALGTNKYSTSAPDLLSLRQSCVSTSLFFFSFSSFSFIF